MAQALTPDAVLEETYRWFLEHERNVSLAARAAGLARQTFRNRVSAYERRFGEQAAPKAGAPLVPTAEVIPEYDGPISELLDQIEKHTERRIANSEAKRWRRFKVPHKGPYALMFFGDPHIDDNGVNMKLLRSHCDLAARTEGLYAINIGDTTNNWAGRLVHLWSNQDTSSHTARRLAKWLLSEAGVPWFLWLHGNHDGWSGPVGKDWFEGCKPNFVTMESWGAKITLVAPNGHELRLWAQHNFKGHSMWNNMHGLEKAAQMKDWAHLYVAGHHHDFGIRQGENPDRNFVYNLARARGYKFEDEHALVHDFPSFKHGASILAVIDPSAQGPNVVQCFADPFEGADYLKFKRAKAG